MYWTGIALALGSCAGDPMSLIGASVNYQSPSAQAAISQGLYAARVQFTYRDFYTVTSPNPNTSCPGDAINFYDYVATNSLSQGSPLLLANSSSNPSQTIRPSFIKNVSVDLTDANSTSPLNQSMACSFGSSTGFAPTSACAIFDLSAATGTDSPVGGRLLILGGTQALNPAGVEPNPTSSPLLFSIGVNAVPAVAAGTLLAPGLYPSPVPSSAISTWSNLTSYLTPSTSRSSTNLLISGTPPQGLAAAASSYDNPTKQIVVFGGSSYQTSSVTNASTVMPTTNNTWSMNTSTGLWSSINSAPNVSSTITQAGTTSRINQGRAFFGMVATAGMAISELGQSGSVGSSHPGTLEPLDAPVDTTERIIITGGMCNYSGVSGPNICTDTLKFNPTYGPEYIDAALTTNSIATSMNISPVQWLDSYHTQSMSNTNSQSQLSPFFPIPSPSPIPTVPYTQYGFGAYGFGMVPLMNNNGGSGGWSAGSNSPGASYLLTAGGFYGLPGVPSSSNTPTQNPDGCIASNASPASPQNQCGGLGLLTKWGSTSTNSSLANEATAENFISLPNLIDSAATQTTPGQWVSYLDGGTQSITPWYGAGAVLKGLQISGATSNEVVYFGGTTCSDFIQSSSTFSPPCTATFANPGRYWSFGSNPAAFPFTSPSSITMQGTVPTNGGMAAARGLDPVGNPVIVAWGGMQSRGSADLTGNIYYLYNNSGSPTWAQASPTPTTVKPKALAHASLVYSHVTGSFYLFGGYDPSQSSSFAVSTTWKLSFSSSSTDCGKKGGCQFQWTQLTPSCYPNCVTPTARWGHQAVEVNYHYFNAPNEPTCQNSATPCSFGIFMEGGQSSPLSSSSSSNFLTDRWMFDPTGNQGQGHWQRMGEQPPRAFASMTQIDYSTLNGGTQNVALLFGGETGLQNPAYYSNGNYFVPPTLGDTWMYDFQLKNWNRVQLLGTRYNGTSIPRSLDERSARASSLISNPNSNENSQILTPPPLSGAIMVTRTLSRATHAVSDSPKTLVLPEVFLFGGRNKEGKLQPLDHVYKFCAGSTGEKPYPISQKNTLVGLPDDATCDAYDPVNNPTSPNPQSGYSGRWLFKNPITPLAFPSDNPIFFNTSQTASFLGAGAYDPQHDLIVVYGGLTAATPAAIAGVSSPSDFSTLAVTQTSQLTTNGSDGGIFEYTPPSKVSSSDDRAINGTWNYIPACNPSLTPSGRYGHSLVFDIAHQNLILSGGFNSSGQLLTQTQTPSTSNTSYTLPEVWTATRIDAPPGGNGAQVANMGTNFPCYLWSPVNSFGNAPGTGTRQPMQSGIAYASTLFIPSVGYNTGYYTLNGPACSGSGTVSGTDQNIGGVYLDIDRTQLGTSENLLLSVTLFPLGPTNLDPDGNLLANNQAASFRVTLVKTGQTLSELLLETQPRAFDYSNTTSYPIRAYDVALLTPPVGQIREEQVMIPLSMDSTIDRIRIERVSGTGIILNASLSRLKPKR